MLPLWTCWTDCANRCFDFLFGFMIWDHFLACLLQRRLFPCPFMLWSLCAHQLGWSSLCCCDSRESWNSLLFTSFLHIVLRGILVDNTQTPSHAVLSKVEFHNCLTVQKGTRNLATTISKDPYAVLCFTRAFVSQTQWRFQLTLLPQNGCFRQEKHSPASCLMLPPPKPWGREANWAMSWGGSGAVC